MRNRGDEYADWLLTDDISSWTGTRAEQAWRFLQQSLTRHDRIDEGAPYRKAALETIIDMNQFDCIPTWLINFFEVCPTARASVE